MSLLRKSSRRHFARHRAQLFLAVLGVTLGVAVVLSIDLAIQSARTGFRISTEAIAGRATHVLSRDVGALDESLVAELRRETDLAAIAPVVEGAATSSALGGRALRLLGVDPFAEAPFRPYLRGDGGGLDVGTLLTTRRGVVLTDGVAGAAGLRVGDSLPVETAGERWLLPVIAVLEIADPLTRTGLSDVLLMDIAGAQEVLRSAGELSRIELRLEESDAAEALQRVEALVGPGVSIRSVGARSETMSGMIAAFDVNLTALSLLALIFGMFLIFNSVTFSVVQRRAMLGRLRAMGVTRAEVLRLILGEAFRVGVVGSLLGLVLGTVMARGLLRLITRTINDLYFTLSVEQISLETPVLAKAAALGVVATVAAALPPALEAAGANPRIAIQRSSVEARARAGVRRAGWSGVGLGVAGALLLTLPTRSLSVSFLALFCIITGMAAITPAATAFVAPLFGRPLRRVIGLPGLLASRGVVDSLSRTAPAVAALVVAVAVTVGLGIMIQSFRGTLVQWLDGTLRADVYVSLPATGSARAAGTLWPDLVEDFRAHPDVAGSSTYRGVDVVLDDDAFHLVALDLDERGLAAFRFLRGGEERAMEGFQAGRGVLVSEPFAYDRGLARGDSVRLPTEDGPAAFEILGVFYDYGSEQGTVMMERTVYESFFTDRGVTSLGLFVRDGVDSEEVVERLLATVAPGRAVVVRTNDTLRNASLEVFDRTFEVTAVLRLLAFVVAFVGVLSALMALELERAREYGLLRASGITPGELRSLVVTQTGLIGTISGLLSIPMGVILSIVMIFVVNKRSFGWTLQMELGSAVVVQALLLAVVGALLAGLYPAWRMSRTSPALALRGE